MKQLLRLVAVASVVPMLASADPLWKGDFETGNTSQWTREQSVSASRLQVVSDVVREGRYALKATVRQGDDPIGASGNRNEVLYLTQEKQGTEYFYKWSTLFPKNYPSSDTWQVVTQWHQEGCCGSPPLEFFVIGEQLNMRVGGSSGKVLWQAPLDRGNWHDFVLHAKWSPNAKVGFVELYHNGKLVVPRTYGANQFGSDKNYVKQGLYRNDTIRPEASVYHDGFVMASKLEDVMPAATPTPQTPPQTTETPVVTAPTPTHDNTSTPPTGTPVVEEPAPETAPVIATPTVGPPTSQVPSVVTGDPSGLPSDPSMGGSSGAGGCSASGGGGGVSAVVAAGLLALAMFRRRQAAPARAHARAKKQG